jgi:phosphonopyruvate decarboxylase
MLDCKHFYDLLLHYGVNFFTGVPANEGGAVALACGHYLATRCVPLVYMQNSGQGNAANPLISLVNPEVYSIPMFLLIGWRGEPGKKDEPQHIKQGRITLAMLDMLDVPYRVLPDTDDESQKCVEQLFEVIKETAAPVALVVKKGTFKPYESQQSEVCYLGLDREDALKLVVDNLEHSDIVVSTTGKISRELYEYRTRVSSDHSRDFLTIGSMGHSSQIAMGIALAKPGRQIFCFDGDGAVIMHMGTLAIIGSQKVKNFKHIIFNNGVHDSVGGQPTAGLSISFTAIARACGYQLALQAEKRSEIAEKMAILRKSKGPALLEIKVKKGARDNLGRPKTSPKENKTAFMEFISK